MKKSRSAAIHLISLCTIFLLSGCWQADEVKYSSLVKKTRLQSESAAMRNATDLKVCKIISETVLSTDYLSRKEISDITFELDRKFLSILMANHCPFNTKLTAQTACAMAWAMHPERWRYLDSEEKIKDRISTCGSEKAIKKAKGVCEMSKVQFMMNLARSAANEKLERMRRHEEAMNYTSRSRDKKINDNYLHSYWGKNCL